MQKLFWSSVVSVAVLACADLESTDGGQSVAGKDASRVDARAEAGQQQAAEDAGVLASDAKIGASDARVTVDAGRADAAASKDAGATRDAGTRPDAGVFVDSGVPTGTCAGVLINEVQVSGVNGASDEFVELYNVGESCGPVTMKLVYRSKTGNSDISLGSWSVSMEKGTYVVVAGRGFKGASDSILSSSLAADSGQLQLRIGNEVLDSLGYGGTSGAFVRGTSAPKPPANGSIGRFEGRDTGDNSADFYALAAPTPGAANPAAP